MIYEHGITKVANFALTALGKDRIQSIDQDNDSANIIKMYYAVILNKILTDYDWNFARRTVDLTQVVPRDEYKNYRYSFALPSDFAGVRRVIPEQYYEIYDNATLRLNAPATRTVQVVGETIDDIIDVEQEFVELTYTKNDLDPMKMNSSFILYLAYSIAAETCIIFTGNLELDGYIKSLASKYGVEAEMADSTKSRHIEYGEKPPWSYNRNDYYRERFRDGGPYATESFLGPMDTR